MTDLSTRLRRTAAASTAADEAADDARDSRNNVIREALDRGWGPAEIAKATGLSPSTISRLIPRLYESAD